MPLDQKTMIQEAVGHRILASRFKHRLGCVWWMFHLSLNFNTFVGGSSHLAYHENKRSHKTATFAFHHITTTTENTTRTGREQDIPRPRSDAKISDQDLKPRPQTKISNQNLKPKPQTKANEDSSKLNNIKLKPQKEQNINYQHCMKVLLTI